MTNKVIENYVLKDKLGSGQYGNVFMAEDQKTKDIVAIKIMNIQKFKTTPKLSEFTSNEINILTKIDSPHIIKFVEMLRTVNNYYLIYEYCNGGTLAQILEKKRFLKETEALKIFAQMVEAFKVLVK